MTQAYSDPKRQNEPRFGVFVHRGDGRYAVPDAIATYRHETAAQKRADALNAKNCVHVVRTLAYCRSGAK